MPTPAMLVFLGPKHIRKAALTFLQPQISCWFVMLRKHPMAIFVHMGQKSKPFKYLFLTQAVNVTDAVPYD